MPESDYWITLAKAKGYLLHPIQIRFKHPEFLDATKIGFLFRQMGGCKTLSVG